MVRTVRLRTEGHDGRTVCEHAMISCRLEVACVLPRCGVIGVVDRAHCSAMIADDDIDANLRERERQCVHFQTDMPQLGMMGPSDDDDDDDDDVDMRWQEGTARLMMAHQRVEAKRRSVA
eukprot:2113370-Rhodomonas_salina.2